MQVILLIVLVFGLAVVYVFTSQAMSGINDSLQADVELSNSSKATMQAATDSYASTFDSIIVFVLVGLWILCLIMAYNSGDNPVLAIFSIIIIAALAVVGAILSNAWEEMSTDSELSTFANDFPMTGYVLDHYMTVVLVIAFSTLMVGVSRSGG